MNVFTEKLKNLKKVLSDDYEVIGRKQLDMLEEKASAFDIMQSASSDVSKWSPLAGCVEGWPYYIVTPNQLEAMQRKNFADGAKNEEEKTKEFEEKWVEEKQRRLELMKLIKED